MSVGQGPMVEASSAQIRPSTVSERLEAEEKHLTKRLEEVRSVRHALAVNPEVQEVIDGLSAFGQLHY